ncbi:MAG: HEPN domain protein [Candidatus Gottesmanbacteria bacterium GW2011_GWC2_39_8]|uniref:HEPN domain protein n=1 Tax=Candidatus Gottesmanbacteria bacterium GW2011_GWC2_39_8 TaxID=1618450 RepID=A0A0G0T8B7_9BACT|nr:MAG: HEPN domain protein [Candidatus Gottesmanbacteria bacterium GW2011_GWC2_39_8]
MKRKADFAVDAKSWLSFAEYDLKTAKWNFEGKIYTSVCYVCQQAAEKALKALILYFGITPPKIHSLDRLISLIRNKTDISEIETHCRNLDKYYITTRYPGQYGGPEGLYDEDDAGEAVISAETILSFVQLKFEQERKV